VPAAQQALIGAVMSDNAETSSQLSSLNGAWRLVSFELERQDTGHRRPALEEGHKGRLVILGGNLIIVVITPNQREAPKSVEERAAAYDSMTAYTGRFIVEGDRLTTTVDISWNESWLRIPQVRTIAFKGERLELRTDWQTRPAQPEVVGRGVLLWEREE